MYPFTNCFNFFIFTTDMEKICRTDLGIGKPLDKISVKNESVKNEKCQKWHKCAKNFWHDFRVVYWYVVVSF